MRTYATYKDEGCALWFHKTSYMLHFLIPQDTTSISVQTHDTTILQSIFLFNSYYELPAALQFNQKQQNKRQSMMKLLYNLQHTKRLPTIYQVLWNMAATGNDWIKAFVTASMYHFDGNATRYATTTYHFYMYMHANAVVHKDFHDRLSCPW